MFRFLLHALLLFPATTYAMQTVYKHQSEQVQLIKLHENIYSLFLENNTTEAKKLLPKDKDMKAFLICGIGKGTSSYFKWILNTKKPLFDSLCVQETLRYVTQSKNDKYIVILNQYIEKEKNKVELESDKMIKIEGLKIDLHQAQEKYDCTKSSDNYTKAKNLKAELDSAQTEFDDLKSKNWKLETSDDSESSDVAPQTDATDCECIVF